MRVAVIDLGTNTFNLLIAELSKGQAFQILYSDRIPVKLGEGTINSNIISPAPFERGLHALRQYRAIMNEYSVKEVKALATSAIRSASNGQDFIQAAWDQFQIPVEIISGEREAELIYKGNRAAVEIGNEPCLVFDIGGGSNEYIICNSEEYFFKGSFKLGVARLLNQFKPEDPISETTVEAIFDYLEKELQPLTDAVKLWQPKGLIGSSGAFESFVDMLAAEDGESGTETEKRNYIINIEAYRKLSAKVRASTLVERQNMKGLIPMRVDMIVLSFLLVDFVLDKYKLSQFRVSAYSLKEGMIAELQEKL